MRCREAERERCDGNISVLIEKDLPVFIAIVSELFADENNKTKILRDPILLQVSEGSANSCDRYRENPPLFILYSRRNFRF